MQIELIEIILTHTHIYTRYIDIISCSRSLIYWSSKTILSTCLAHLIVIPVISFEKIVECSADITVSHIQVCGNTQEKLCVHACYVFVIFPSKNSNVKPNIPILFDKKNWNIIRLRMTVNSIQRNFYRNRLRFLVLGFIPEKFIPFIYVLEYSYWEN